MFLSLQAQPLRKLSKRGSFSKVSKGLTLLDLLIVILILGILGVIVIPRFQSMAAETRLNEAAMELVSALQYTAGLAIQYQRPFGLQADVSGNWFKVFDTDPYPDATATVRPDNTPPVNASDVVINPVDKTWYDIDYDTLNIYNGVSLNTVPAGNEIRFYPDGHSGSSDKTFAVTNADKTKTITINGATGRITVQ